MESDPEIAVPSGETAVMWATAASRVASVALTFCGVALALLFFNAGLVKKANPCNHPEMASMLDRLQEAEKARQPDEVARLIRDIRDFDSSARTRFFRAHAAAREGWTLLVFGAAVFLLASKAAAVLRRKAPMPPAAPGPGPGALNLSVRNAIAAVMAATAIALLIASCSAPERKTPNVERRTLNVER